MTVRCTYDSNKMCVCDPGQLGCRHGLAPKDDTERIVAAIEGALRPLLKDGVDGVLVLDEFEHYVAAVLNALRPLPPSWLSHPARADDDTRYVAINRPMRDWLATLIDYRANTIIDAYDAVAPNANRTEETP